MARSMFMENPAFVEEERLTRELHLLNAQGEGDSVEAEAIQDASEKPWYKLSEEEQDRISGLSADLYQLTGEEVHEKTELSQEQLETSLVDACVRDDPVEILSLLRKGPTCSKDHDTAFWRWVCYRELGHFETAVLFLEYAVKLAPGVYPYAFCLLGALAEVGRKEETMRMVQESLAEPATHPYVQIFAACLKLRELVSEAHHGDGSEWRQLANVLKNALAAESTLPAPQRIAALRVDGFIYLSRCYRRSKNQFKAKLAFDDAFALDPARATALGGVDLKDANLLRREQEEMFATVRKRAGAEALAVA
jgi:tetratricopeptide (TPR) repeat protein